MGMTEHMTPTTGQMRWATADYSHVLIAWGRQCHTTQGQVGLYPVPREVGLLIVLGSVQFSRSVMSSYLRPHGLQQNSLPCPPPTSWACSDSCPSSWWCHSTTSSSFCPLLLLPSIFPSIRVFPKESVLHIRWLNCWNFNFSISPSNEYSGLISSRTDWFDLLSVQGTLKSLFSNTTVQKYQFFSDQLSL